MKELLLILGMIYVFIIGYVFVTKADKFMRKNPRAFPRIRRIIIAKPTVHNSSDESEEVTNHE